MDGALASAQRVTRANEHEERTRAGCSLSLTAILLDCGTCTANCGDTELGWYKDTPSPTLLFVFMQCGNLTLLPLLRTKHCLLHTSISHERWTMVADSALGRIQTFVLLTHRDRL